MKTIFVILMLLITTLASSDDRLYAVVYAEAAGGSDAEIQAVIATYRNVGINKSCAYRFKSKQYLKAINGDLNAYEKKVFNRIKSLPLIKAPYLAHENIKSFGVPYWAGDYKHFIDIGRQRFYWR